MSGQPILSMHDIVKTYPMGDETLTVLKHIDFSVEAGEFVSILGPSGSGKSTMMNIIGCLDSPTSGEYHLKGKDVAKLSESELARIRNAEIGFVFQSFQLLPRQNALENVELPLIYARVPQKERRERAEAILERMGLVDKMGNFPNQLSGGQQQRVAIARAVVTNPSIVLADEPTGALDQKTGHQVMDLFTQLNGEGRTVVMITHDHHIASYASRIVSILDGEFVAGEEDAHV
jgi:putative ABC transport system ATP-binding protein